MSSRLERMRCQAGKRKADIIRELIDEAIAGHTTDGMNRKKG
jgi:predicted DNA-binding protein